jgi:hypothetical protein
MSDGAKRCGHPATRDDLLKYAARRIARRCRWIIQGCLREEEWGDCEDEFNNVVIEELERLAPLKIGGAKQSKQSGDELDGQSFEVSGHPGT